MPALIATLGYFTSARHVRPINAPGFAYWLRYCNVWLIVDSYLDGA
jgi:hypothetical protein